MKKVLVVYYSRSGHTRAVAKRLAIACDADLESIEDDAPRKQRYGILGYLKCALEAIFQHTVPICGSDHNAQRYDLVIIGTPIWFWSMSSPVRTYIQRHHSQFKNVAYFCTFGGGGQSKVLKNLEDLGGKAPIASLAIPESEVTSKLYTARVAEFAVTLKKVVPFRSGEGRPQVAARVG
jgi:flavodoxin